VSERVTFSSSVSVEDWQRAAQFNSPDSVRQAVILGLAAILLASGFLVLRAITPSAAEDAGVKTKVTPCRSA
jgi:hypothetical protein